MSIIWMFFRKKQKTKHTNLLLKVYFARKHMLMILQIMSKRYDIHFLKEYLMIKYSICMIFCLMLSVSALQEWIIIIDTYLVCALPLKTLTRYLVYVFYYLCEVVMVICVSSHHLYGNEMYSNVALYIELFNLKICISIDTPSFAHSLCQYIF